MTCPVCQNQNPAGSWTCGECGAKGAGAPKGVSKAFHTGWAVVKDTPLDDPHYTEKNKKCPECGDMNTGDDTCAGKCGNCWACGCDCDE